MSDGRITDLVEWLDRHEPLDVEEHAAVRHLRQLVVNVADPFLRTTLPVHVTASAIVFDEQDHRVLLHMHRRLHRWLQPGGHVEPGERPADAAMRETLEETGVAVDHPDSGPSVLHLDEHPGPDGHIHLDLRYLLLADRALGPVGAGEATGDGPGATLQWMDLTEVAAVADRSLMRAVRALERRLA
jgi:8-oxo-dGTP pyrophosphatase MutT (NUDIX family)